MEDEKRMTKLFCLGDSLTFGYGVPHGDCWVERFARTSGWNTVNRGISGDTTGGMLTRLERDVLKPARATRADGTACAVLILGGTNDVFFSGTDVPARANITAISHQLLAEGISPVIGVPLPVDWLHVPEKWKRTVDFCAAARLMDIYGDWLRTFAACTGYRTVDFAADFFDGEGRVRRELLLDGIHPNAAGHRTMADRLLATLAGGTSEAMQQL